MTDYEAIYRDHAREYDRMVRAEDCDGELAQALAAVTPLRGKTVLEIGVGTGRVTELLLRAGARVVGVERAPAMIAIARERLEAWDGWAVSEADARSLPIADESADLAVSGWVLGHMTHWEGDAWRDAVDGAVAEMRRVVRTGGPVVILETLGSGTEEAGAPNEALAAYYRHLEGHHGFARSVLRTDYQFDSVEEAAGATAFFFGDAFAERVRDHGWARIPEHTGMWISRSDE